MRAALTLSILCCLGPACSRGGETAPARPATSGPDLAPLHAFEAALRSSIDFARQPPWDESSGANPIALAALPDGRAVGVLRGSDAVVLLDAELAEIDRAPAPASPTGLALTADGTIWVSGEEAAYLEAFRVEGAHLRGGERIELGEVLAVRDIATGPEGVVYLVEEQRGRLIALVGGAARDIGRCHGPTEVIRTARHVVVNCLLDHAVEVRAVGADGVPGAAPVATVRHDGPIWAVDAREDAAGTLWLGLGGIEDRPLDRSDGAFGYIDSFAFVYRVDAAGAARIAAVNASALGAISTKAVALEVGAGGSQMVVAGYGGDQLATLRWPGLPAGEPAVATTGAPPGIAALARDGDSVVAANPLLDAWLRVDDAGRVALREVGDGDPRSVEQRVGEAVFFTSLMAPWNEAEGRRSRFTCEACHYEGYIDGRVHYTGRGEIHAATKPLVGLGNNRPHFSRALDRTMTQMVHNEFRVANKHNGRSPWFSLPRDQFPWLRSLGEVPEQLSAVYLRRSLMAFLFGYAHRANPSALGRSELTALERNGAAVFRQRCEDCHQARLVADRADSRVAPSAWQPLILSPSGPIVWASDAYAETGVEPYVHDAGARVPSLRRLYKKWPYFTNGSAASIAEVLAAAGWRGDGFFHAGAPAAAERLSPREQAELRAFLALL